MYVLYIYNKIYRVTYNEIVKNIRGMGRIYHYMNKTSYQNYICNVY